MIIRVVAMSFLLCCSCKAFEGEGLGADTKHKLLTIHDIATRFSFEQLAKFDTMEDFLAEAELQRLTIDEKSLRCDGWGNAFSWAVAKNHSVLLIKITSVGKSGKAGEPPHDDIWIEINSSKGARPILSKKSF